MASEASRGEGCSHSAMEVRDLAQEILGEFNLDTEINRFAPDSTSAGRRAETLIKNDRLRVVLVTMRTGAALHDHNAPGPITIHTVRGSFAVTVGGEERQVDAGSLISIEAGVRHAVRALDDGAFLLTIGGPLAPM